MKEYTVYCSECKEWVYSRDIEFIDIEEDISGRDNVTFICNKCQTKNKSLVCAQNFSTRRGCSGLLGVPVEAIICV